jgi:hypothetical protein
MPLLSRKQERLLANFCQVVKNTAVRKSKGLQKAPAFLHLFSKALLCLLYHISTKKQDSKI